MKTVQLTQEQYNELITKAAKYDALQKKIESFYFDEEGNEKEDGDLADIGEAAAIHFGLL